MHSAFSHAIERALWDLAEPLLLQYEELHLPQEVREIVHDSHCALRSEHVGANCRHAARLPAAEAATVGAGHHPSGEARRRTTGCLYGICARAPISRTKP